MIKSANTFGAIRGKGAPMTDNEPDLLDRYRMYREEDRHECGLLSTRVTGLLTSQTIFAGIVTFIYQAPVTQGDPVPRAAILICVACLACVMAYLACVAICVGILVLRGWHLLGRILEDSDTKHVLDGYHLKRRQPDPLHTLSVDWFNIGLPICFGAAWIAVITANLGF